MVDSFCNLLGGGDAARIFLWRNKKISATLLGGATVTWYVIGIGFPVLSLVGIAYAYWQTVVFILSNPKHFNHRLSMTIPDLRLRDELFHEVAAALHAGINRALTLPTENGAKFTFTKYLITYAVVTCIVILAISVSFSTLLYAVIVLLFTVPIACEKVAASRAFKRMNTLGANCVAIIRLCLQLTKGVDCVAMINAVSPDEEPLRDDNESAVQPDVSNSENEIKQKMKKNKKKKIAEKEVIAIANSDGIPVATIDVKQTCVMENEENKENIQQEHVATQNKLGKKKSTVERKKKTDAKSSRVKKLPSVEKLVIGDPKAKRE